MKRTFYVNSTPGFKGWETCFHFLMEKSDTFRIIFQGSSDTSDADTFLNAGKREFLSMPSITISPYGGMENSIEATGELNMAARKFFQTFMEPAFEGYNPDMWSFKFLKGMDVLLETADFTEGWLYLEESEIEDLHTQGVDVTNLEEMNSFLTEAQQSDAERVVRLNKEELSSFTEKAMRLNKEELSSFADLLRTSFLAEHENEPAPPQDDL